MKKIDNHAHWEIRRGSADEARVYCMKADTRLEGPWEYGEASKGQGQRRDLEEATHTALTTRSIRAVAQQHPSSFVKYHNGFQSLLFHTTTARTEPPRVLLYYGVTGSGKTRQAYADYGDALYRKAPDTVWFDGYCGQKTLLLDDFAGAASKMSLSYLLQLLDRYPIDVQVKGSYASLQATKIIITSNLHPRLWYDYSKREGQYQALIRRIHEIWLYREDGCPLYISRSSFANDWWEGCNEASTLENVTRPNTPEPSDEEILDVLDL